MPRTVFSFAIFGTLLTHRTATTSGIFQAMRQHLRLRPDRRFPAQLIEEFPAVRLDAERSARQSAGTHGAIDLDAIYRQFSARYPELDRRAVAELKGLELELSLSLALGIPENIALVHRLLDAGERVILTSDSYFSAVELNRLLSQIDARLAACPCYAAADLGRTKESGALFRSVFAAEGIAPAQLIHRGDNPWSDLKVPRALGCQASLYQGGELSELEWAYLDEGDLCAQLVAGTARAYRILHPDASNPARLGAILAGPLFYGFIRYVLDEAQRRGIRRLYFIARDGRIFLRLAQAIARTQGLEIDLRYLYGSRRAFRFAALFDLGPREQRWLAERIPTLSLAMLAERLEMTGSELYDQLPSEFQGCISDLEAPLPEALAGELVGAFEHLPKLRQAILAKAESVRTLLIDYLKQEGFFDGGPVGTVDIGWMGGSQDALYKVAASYRSDIEIHGFYFGLFYYSGYTSLRNRKSAYAIRPNQAVDNIVALHTELLAQADHGQTMGYERLPDGRVQPLLRGDAGYLQAWGIAEFLDAAEWFAAEYTRLALAQPLMSEHFDAMVPRLLSLMRRPPPLVAETLGRIPYSGDHCDLALRESAPAFSWREALIYTFGRRYEERRLMTEWYEATLVRSGRLARLILRLQPIVQQIKVMLKHPPLNLLRRLRMLKGKFYIYLSERSALKRLAKENG